MPIICLRCRMKLDSYKALPNLRQDERDVVVKTSGAPVLATRNLNSLACNFAHSLSNNGSRPRIVFVSSFTLPTYAILPSSTWRKNSSHPFAYAGSNIEQGS